MKKGLFFISMTLIIIMSASCNDNTVTHTEQIPSESIEQIPSKSTEQTMPNLADNEFLYTGNDISSEPLNDPFESGSDLALRSTIIGDVYFNDIAISRIFEEPFFDIFGSHLYEGDHSFHYNDFVILSFWDFEREERKYASQFVAVAPILNQFEINGITFDITKTELIAAFGNPTQYYDNEYWEYQNAVAMRYHIISPTKDYILIFRFENLDDNETVSSISINTRSN